MKAMPKMVPIAMRMDRQRIGVVAAAAAERARDRRGDAAAHRARRHHLHQHDDREHQRDAGERGGAELADEIGLDQPDRGLRHHDEHVGRREPQQGRGDRRFEQQPRARIAPLVRRRPATAGASGGAGFKFVGCTVIDRPLVH